MSYPVEQPTETQRRIRELAAQMAAANPDAAEELAKALAAEALAQKRPPCLGLGIRFNLITQKVEVIVG
jgi:hypothetical protein